MTDVVVIGAGPAGAATALFAARRGHSVVVVERDAPPPAGFADNAAWRRQGAPHTGQGHLFLARSTQVLRDEAPDVLDAVFAAGGCEVPLAGGGRDGTVLARRLVYEAALRRAVEREPGVTVLSGCGAAGLRFAGRGGAAPRVAAVRLDDGSEVPADLTVDAGGRRSPVYDWVRADGAPVPPPLGHGSRFFYLTRHYRLRPGAAPPPFRLPLVAALDFTTVLVFPEDNGWYQISLISGLDDPLRARLRDPLVFDRLIAEVPMAAPWADAGEPVDEPQPVARVENRWRTLVGDGGPPATGVVLVGDTAVQTNPTAGRGVSLAFVHAQRLARTLDRMEDDPLGFATDFEAWTAQHLGVWFRAQLAMDEARTAQLQASFRGTSAPTATDPGSRVITALASLYDVDAEVAAVADRLYNVLLTPGEVFADRAVARRILAAARSGVGIAAAAGPDRRAFERLAH